MKRFGVLVNWARFRHRSSHVPNVTDKLSTAKEWRLNEFGMAVLIRCGRSHYSTLERHVIRTALLSSAEPNAYMHYIEFIIFPTIPLVFT